MFMDLPEEIIRIILQYLDIKSIQNLHDTCNDYMRGIILNQGVVKNVNMSLSTVATAKFLKTNFFINITPFIQELDMSTVHDLCKTTFLSAIKKLRALKRLNVSYTPIKIEHLANVTDSCPELKTICTNFQVSKKITIEFLRIIQLFLEKMDNVHFVFTAESPPYPNLVFYFLEKAKLNSLRFTVTHHNMLPKIFTNHITCKVPEFNQFYFILGSLHLCHYPDVSRIPVFITLDLNLFEFIIMCSTNLKPHQVYVSQLFVDFFNRHFNLDPCHIKSLNVVDFNGKVVIMFWKKDTTIFDEAFFRNLIRHLKQFFPYCIKEDELTAPNTYDWFVVTPKVATNDDTGYVPSVKSRRIGVKPTVLHYDTLFRDKERIEISFNFSQIFRGGVTLSSNSNYLSKITYLNLYGLVRYSPDFFRILFDGCKILKTLNVEAHSVSPCSQSICRFLPLCRSLKNFRLIDLGINFMTMFSAFSECSLIENIFIRENSNIKPSVFSDPSLLFENCINLYHLCLDFPTSASLFKIQRPLFNSIKAKYNSSLNVVLLPRTGGDDVHSFYEYSPYIKVFKLNPV